MPAEWQRRTILYWDKISSVVPEAWDEIFRDRTMLLSPQAKKSYDMMKYLESEGEFEPVRPNYCRVPLEQEFKQIIESPDFQNKISKNWMNSAIPVYKDKVGNSVYDFLHEKDLAMQENVDEDWYLMEKNTSLLYMALLAKYLADGLAKSDGDYVVSGTDSEEYQTMVFKRDMQYKGFYSFETQFQKILPVPRDDVRIEDLVKFKQERKTELLKFREVMKETTDKISEAESQNEMNYVLVQQEEKMEIEVSRIKTAMKNSNISATLASVKSLMDIKKPECMATLAAVLAPKIPENIPTDMLANIPANIPGDLLAKIPIGYILAAYAGIQVTCTWIEAKNAQRAKALDSPYSYLYYADNADIIDLSYMDLPKKPNIIQRLLGN